MQKSDFLSKILSKKSEEIKIHKAERSLEVLKQYSRISTRNFTKAIGRDGMNIIAEIKKASPSRGVIRDDFDSISIASTYERCGAAALSVLTDKPFFHGSLHILDQVSRQVGIPVLRKDFILDPYQLYEAKFFGADAVLLIASILDRYLLSEFLEISDSLGLAALVEVHDEEDTEKALAVGSKIIGINNRNLRTFQTDLETTSRLRKLISHEEHLVVSESGIETRAHVQRFYSEGVNAVLIGESLMREKDIAKKFKEFVI